MKKRQRESILAIIILFLFPAPCLAQHQHESTKGTAMKMYAEEIVVEGVRIAFQIMANKEHEKMLEEMGMKEKPEKGTTHNISVKLLNEATQEEITDAGVRMKVVNPKGMDQIKSLRLDGMMKSYSGYFNLSEKGKYELIIVFGIGEKKRNAGIYYEIP
ncbi:MAG: hypothetical protein ABII06_14065 [Pseudomonadota bacterium]